MVADKKTTYQEGSTNMDHSSAQIGIITALPKEYAAMKRMLENCHEVYNNARGNAERYLMGQIKSADGNLHHVVLMMCGEGNNSAAIRCTQLLSVFPDIRAIVMCGIAGGFPNPSNPQEHVRLGDIAVAKSVIQYDYGKKKGDSWEEKAVPTKISSSFSRAIAKLQADEYEGIYEWRTYVSKFATGSFAKPSENEDVLYDLAGNIIQHPENPKREGFPLVHYGRIASANIVLKDIHTREELREKYKVIAAEMEGSGIADASTDENVNFVIVRGICDYCDLHKNDLWQNYAALVAAAYTRCLIENLPSFDNKLSFSTNTGKEQDYSGRASTPYKKVDDEEKGNGKIDLDVLYDALKNRWMKSEIDKLPLEDLWFSQAQELWDKTADDKYGLLLLAAYCGVAADRAKGQQCFDILKQRNSPISMKALSNTDIRNYLNR